MLTKTTANIGVTWVNDDATLINKTGGTLERASLVQLDTYQREATESVPGTENSIWATAVGNSQGLDAVRKFANLHSIFAISLGKVEPNQKGRFRLRGLVDASVAQSAEGLSGYPLQVGTTIDDVNLVISGDPAFLVPVTKVVGILLEDFTADFGTAGVHPILFNGVEGLGGCNFLS